MAFVMIFATQKSNTKPVGNVSGEIFLSYLKFDNEEFPVVMRLWVTPVPIPNTMVKT